MVYPTSSLDRAIEDADRLAIQVKGFATRERDRMVAGNVAATSLIDMAIRIRQARVQLATIAAMPGIGDRAKEIKGDTNLDVGAEFNAMLAAMDAVVLWVRNNFPTANVGGTLYLARETWGSEGPVDRQFSSAQTAALCTELDNLIATIN